MASDNKFESYIDKAEPYYTTQAPFQLPEDLTKKIADIAWILALVFGILSLLIALGAVEIWQFTGSVGPALGVTPSPVYWLGVVLVVAQAVLLLMAVPGLKKKDYKRGWLYLFYAVVVSIVGGIIMALAGDFGSVFGTVLTLLIGPFILFQIKPRFLPAKSGPTSAGTFTSAKPDETAPTITPADQPAAPPADTPDESPTASDDQKQS